MKSFLYSPILIVSLILTFFTSCNFSDSDRKAAEEKLVAEGVFKPDSIIKKEDKYNELITGRWILDKVYFVKTKQTVLYQKKYVKSGDNVTTIDYANGTMQKVVKYAYSVNNLPNGLQTSESGYNISDDLLMERLFGSNKAPTGTTYYYRIQKINEDSLVVKYLGVSINGNPEMEEEENPYIGYYLKMKE